MTRRAGSIEWGASTVCGVERVTLWRPLAGAIAVRTTPRPELSRVFLDTKGRHPVTGEVARGRYVGRGRRREWRRWSRPRLELTVRADATRADVAVRMAIALAIHKDPDWYWSRAAKALEQAFGIDCTHSGDEDGRPWSNPTTMAWSLVEADLAWATPAAVDVVPTQHTSEHSEALVLAAWERLGRHAQVPKLGGLLEATSATDIPWPSWEAEHRHRMALAALVALDQAQGA
jgi:hypothetical protein